MSKQQNREATQDKNQHDTINSGSTNKNSKQETVISPRQSSSIIASSIIGVGVLALPRVTAEVALEAAWISVVAGSFIGMVVLWMITQLGLRFPYMNIVEYSHMILGSEQSAAGVILGKVLTFPVVLALMAFWLTSIASVSRTFGEVVVGAVLTNTPIEVIILTMLITGFILCMYKVEVVARVNEILLPIIIIPVLFIALFSFQSFELENMLPIWPNLSITQLLYGALLSTFAYHGYELITVFSAYTHVSRKNIRANLLGIVIPATLYMLIVLAGVSVFGVDELKHLMWPTLELVKVTQVPGLVLERMESAFLGVWVAAVFTSVANLFYVSTIVISQYFKLTKYRRWIALIILPVIFWVSLIPQNIIELFTWQKYIGYFGVIISLVIPSILFFIAKVRKKGVQNIPYEDEDHQDDGSVNQKTDQNQQKTGNDRIEKRNIKRSSADRGTQDSTRQGEENDQNNR